MFWLINTKEPRMTLPNKDKANVSLNSSQIAESLVKQWQM